MENQNKNKNNKRNLLLRAIKGKRLSPAASITVEASFVLPVFLFFFINVLGAFEILRLQCDMTKALHQTGSQIMESAAVSRLSPADDEEGLADLLGKAAVTAYADHKVKDYFKDNDLKHSLVFKGAGDISLAESALYSGNDIVDLVASTRVHPVFGIAGFTDFGVESRFYGHAFTGYDIVGNGREYSEAAEELVFITDSGTVYHRSIDCSHLRIRIQSVSKTEVKNMRSNDGAKYYACELCGNRPGSTVYITSYGNRYHTDNNCSGLKRTIRTVPISEVGGRRACADCG